MSHVRFPVPHLEPPVSMALKRVTTEVKGAMQLILDSTPHLPWFSPFTSHPDLLRPMKVP